MKVLYKTDLDGNGELSTAALKKSEPPKQELTDAEKQQIFEEEFYPHLQSVYNFAYHLTFNEADSKDLMQETFLKAYRFLDSYAKGTNARAWLFKILRNAFINEHRRRDKQPTSVDYDEIVQRHEGDDVTDNNFEVRSEAVTGRVGDEVAQAINALPVDFRTVVLLCDIEGFTYEEIAKIIDIPIGTVRSRLHRARHELKKKLYHYAQKQGYILDERE
ncbi:MAG: sigma-70 family RNA polymerase sigma factor [Sphingobacteriales bacterium]|jgi:RNA polymerase sigma factor (sigma-70 family)|nr:sigma-70 family RNA polymerase sigma factor [Sphingobacteriales bacterium]MBP9141832.1 sigma-70 family RNA polymerase sigma factor [Chitinophagales bacterium]MDA0199529.1 sigma-70 family RNA polymerase sigma factor [Bacteroidota bacterium]MBK7527690.1 sigma-70 family RNA polymerase sigma factor [Sphingobacteriales bacterium]MBK8678680.1 sigma-70 family RNA polymerase sigma factor [Sphingobacteriales bacterium]